MTQGLKFIGMSTQQQHSLNVETLLRALLKEQQKTIKVLEDMVKIMMETGDDE